MKHIVVQGGTDGMGRGIALTCLRRGDTVVIIGRDPKKGESFLAAADGIGAEARAHFIPADLSLISENERVIRQITEEFPAVDALVLCARHFLAQRRETVEGHESTLALFYLSRFLLSYGLRDLLEKAPRPVIMNVAGPGSPTGEIHWQDLQMKRDYDGLAAQMQEARPTTCSVSPSRTGTAPTTVPAMCCSTPAVSPPASPASTTRRPGAMSRC